MKLLEKQTQKRSETSFQGNNGFYAMLTSGTWGDPKPRTSRPFNDSHAVERDFKCVNQDKHKLDWELK